MDFATVLAALSDGPAIVPPDSGTCGTSTAPDPSTRPGASIPCPGTSAGCPGQPGGDGDLEEDEGYLAAVEQRGQVLPSGVIGVRVAERLAPGPDLVAWLALVPAGDASDYDLAGGASSWRRIASYAQAQELAFAAQIASRAAGRDPRVGTSPDGRPARIPAAAVAEVSLALTMSQDSAAAWTDLAVDLTWRLPATGAALAQGLIDLPRAKLITGETSLLSQDDARTVEARVLPAAGQQTTAMLRHALRRAVIAADPQGAEQRKKAAERRAKVRMYPDPDHTATITAQGLPPIRAAAAMARLTAMAWAMKAAGYCGGIDFLRTQVLIGLILGTLPLIPPPADGPSDGEPGPDEGPDDPGGLSGGGQPEPCGPDGGLSTGPAGPDDPDDGPESDGYGPCSGPWDGFPDPRDEDAPNGTGDDADTGSDVLAGTYLPDRSCKPRKGPPGSGQPPDDDWPGPRDDGDWLDTSLAPPWPGLPASIPRGPAPPGPGPGVGMSRPVPGLLDVTVPWRTLTGVSPEPGHLGRIGPVTAPDARFLANCAAGDPAASWRVVIISATGQALAVTRLRRRRGSPASTGRPGLGQGLVGRVTVTIPEDILDGEPPVPAGPDVPPVLTQAFRRASRALAHARATALADADAGGCAHLEASTAYRVPPRQRDYLIARDVTCRYPTCRRPAWLCDIDHTKPYDQGGRTCKCNNGALCRTHHQIKQLPGWTLLQVSPGVFHWITPGGRTYGASPDTYAL